MALNTHLALASWNLALNAALDASLASGFIEIYDSTGTGQPLTPDVAVTTQVLLAKLPLSATAFAAASGGSKLANAITSASALATSTATWFRAYKSDNVTAVIDGSVGTSGSDMNLNTTSIVTGATIAVTSWSVSMPVGQ
jgi:hypothetical protein